MKKNIVGFIVAILAILTCIGTVLGLTIRVAGNDEAVDTTTISEDYIPSEPVEEEKEQVIILNTVKVERVEPTTYDEANTCYQNVIAIQETAKSVLKGLMTLGYGEDHPAVTMMKTHIEDLNKDIQYYQEFQKKFEEIHKWEVRASEYPVATQVWQYMKNEFKWSDTVCAGIIGNMMAECGGCWTSDLHWQSNSSHGLGMIQWIGGRRNSIIKKYGNNPTVEEQLLFMRDELYGTNGVRRQVSEEQFNMIMNAQTPEECAFAFATYYERCAEQYRAPRRGYAKRAYDYFTK
jgi:hypothetical protein